MNHHSCITWTVTAATARRGGAAAPGEVDDQVRAAVLELVPQLPDPGEALLVQVDTEHGRLYPGLGSAGAPDAAATAASCDFLVNELLAALADAV